MKHDRPRIPLREKAGYFSAAAVTAIYWQLFSMFLLYFYTDIYGITAAAAGTMFLVTRFSDAIIDPICGLMADRTKSRWGRFRPWILCSAVPFGLFGILTFTTPDLSTTGKLLWAYVTYIGVLIAYTAVEVPSTSLIGVSTPDTNDRTGMAAWKMAGAYAGCIVAQGLTLWLVMALGGGDEKTGYQLTATVYAILTVIALWFFFIVARERVASKGSRPTNVRGDLKALLTTGPWIVLVAAATPMTLAICLRNGTFLYYFKYYVRDESLVTAYMVMGSAACLVATILLKPASRWLGKKAIFCGAMVLMTVVEALSWFARPEDLVAIFAAQFVIAFLSGPIFALMYAMYADIADYIELRDGTRATGLVYSAGAFIIKFGWTMGGAVAGWVLAVHGFEPNVEQTPQALEGIRHMMTTIPAIPSLLAAFLILAYPLNERQVEAIADTLKARRCQAEEQSNISTTAAQL